MDQVLKVTPEKLWETCDELKQLSLETKCIMEKYDLLLKKMDSELEMDIQTVFKDSVQDFLKDAEKFTVMCDKHCENLRAVIHMYINAEASYAIDINSRFL